MKILVVGAGAVGGYFGGRLCEKGVDVTFLVREKRRQQLIERGLVIHSVHGDVKLEPKLLVSGESAPAFDLVVLTPKAYHLDDTLRDVQPYIGEETDILPLLNGIAHMPVLQERFGEERVLGGICFIESTLNEHGDVVQTSKTHRLTYGEWNGERTARVEKLEALFAGAKATFASSDHVVRDMWHKYLFITTLSGMTTLFNSAVGPVLEAVDGRELTKQLFEEAAAVMRAHGAPIAENIVEQHMITYEKQTYHTKSSMLRDMEKGLPIEADHLQGYLLSLADRYGVNTPLLRIVYNNLKVYENKRAHGT